MSHQFLLDITNFCKENGKIMHGCKAMTLFFGLPLFRTIIFSFKKHLDSPISKYGDRIAQKLPIAYHEIKENNN